VDVIGSDKVFIVEGKSFMWGMKSNGLKIDPWGNPCVTHCSLIGEEI
jgi:uncharacterized protein (DUF362 family)